MTKYLREERFALAPGFRGFSPRTVGSIALGSITRQNIITEVHGGGKTAHVMVAKKQREKQRRGQ